MEGLIFGIVAVSLAIWAMLDVIRASMTMNHRILWMILVILFPVVGPLIYFLKGKKKVS
ncbi:MAG: PLD nuclease N-terminal domain-containing protein [Cyclobacteriaceae bacterium]|tara:strand:+ start:201 stop:377 length:177 start_codon:yes stop_codon:yes gene_type:complete